MGGGGGGQPPSLQAKPWGQWIRRRTGVRPRTSRLRRRVLLSQTRGPLLPRASGRMLFRTTVSVGPGHGVGGPNTLPPGDGSGGSETKKSRRGWVGGYCPAPPPPGSVSYGLHRTAPSDLIPPPPAPAPPWGRENNSSTGPLCFAKAVPMGGPGCMGATKSTHTTPARIHELPALQKAPGPRRWGGAIATHTLRKEEQMGTLLRMTLCLFGRVRRPWIDGTFCRVCETAAAAFWSHTLLPTHASAAHVMCHGRELFVVGLRVGFVGMERKRKDRGATGDADGQGGAGGWQGREVQHWWFERPGASSGGWLALGATEAVGAERRGLFAGKRDIKFALTCVVSLVWNCVTNDTKTGKDANLFCGVQNCFELRL